MENYFILNISKKLSFGKKLSRRSKIKEGNILNNCECQRANSIINYSANYNYIYNNFIRINFQELLMYININNQQFLNSLLYNNLLTIINCTYFDNNIFTNNNEY